VERFDVTKLMQKCGTGHFTTAELVQDSTGAGCAAGTWTACEGSVTVDVCARTRKNHTTAPPPSLVGGIAVQLSVQLHSRGAPSGLHGAAPQADTGATGCVSIEQHTCFVHTGHYEYNFVEAQRGPTTATAEQAPHTYEVVLQWLEHPALLTATEEDRTRRCEAAAQEFLYRVKQLAWLHAKGVQRAKYVSPV